MQSSWGLILLCPTYLLFVLAKVESSLFCTYLELIPFLHLFTLIRTYWSFFQFILLKK